MKTYETSATVEAAGQVCVVGVPFAAGTEVDVLIRPKRESAEEFSAAWQRVCSEIRSTAGTQDISDEEIQKEIDDYRAAK